MKKNKTVSKALSWLWEIVVTVFLILTQPIIPPHCGLSYVGFCILIGLVSYIFMGLKTTLIATGIYLLFGILVALTFVLKAVFENRQD